MGESAPEHGADQIEPVIRGAGRVLPGDQGVDVIESAPPWQPRLWRPMMIGIALSAVVVAALAGYLVGARRDEPAGADRHQSATSSISEYPFPLVGTGRQCSAQVGSGLQLGVEVVNQSSSPLQLVRIEPDLPIGGLRLKTAAWGTCGELTPSTATSYPLEAGVRQWVTMILEVIDPCPAPYPVQFVVTYSVAGSAEKKARVGGFVDLGNVPYSGCTRVAKPSGS